MDEELRQSAAQARAAYAEAEEVNAKLLEEQIKAEVPGSVLPLTIPMEGSLQDTFAIVHVSGKQWKVLPDDVILVDPLMAPVGSHIVLEKVLLVGTETATAIGRPLLDGACVHAFVEEQSRTSKLTIFKKKRRKRYRRMAGARPAYTALRIQGIYYDDADSLLALPESTQQEQAARATD